MSKGRKILLIDDDEFYRGALKKVLIMAGHEVTEAAEGVGAQHIIGVQSFDVVISDIRMPGMDGLTLLKWIKANSSVPVVLITGFSEIIETSEAFRLGASGFLLKPFRMQDIARAIDEATPSKEPPKELEQDLDDSYCKIPLGDFVTGSRIHFNVFIRVSSSKYVRIGYQGEDISLERIRGYKSKGVHHVYLTREDFAKYIGFSLDLARKVGKSNQLSAEKKRNFLRYTGEVVLESLYVQDLNKEAFVFAKEFTETALSVLGESGEAFALLESMNAHADFLYAHCVGVSLYSVLIAQALDWHSSPTLFKVSVGGLLHDIGLKEIPREILEKSRAVMNQEERKLYETHTVRGMELMNQVRCAPGDAILIAYQHHEDCAGLGYPKKLSKKKIHPMARLIAVADAFCEFAIKGPETEGMSGGEALARMTAVGEDRLDPEFLAGLRQAFLKPDQKKVNK